MTDVILPAAGLASRMRGLPKFLLPANDQYESLLEIHLSNLIGKCENIYLPTRPELSPIIKSLDFDLDNLKIIEMTTRTMSETILETINLSNSKNYTLIMPDTYFLGEKPYDNLLGFKNFCNLACWEIRDSQRGKLGEVKVNKLNEVEEIVDKKPKNGFKYAWGAVSFSRDLKKYIDIKDPHIGYAVKQSILNNEKVNSFKVRGKYFDCGTPDEYAQLLKETLF
tara:strand:+ start:7272 stop:7943 length:672 start_codon:yes stop_codon:yes gene_type:complete